MVAGWTSAAYTTAFRVRMKGKEDAWKGAEKALSNGLLATINRGRADVLPATSGKRNASAYLMEAFGAQPWEFFAMGDDDNDVSMCQLACQAFIPATNGPAMKQAVHEDPAHFKTPSQYGHAGTKEALKSIMASIEHL